VTFAYLSGLLQGFTLAVLCGVLVNAANQRKADQAQAKRQAHEATVVDILSRQNGLN
jgi:hypothetical protein